MTISVVLTTTTSEKISEYLAKFITAILMVVTLSMAFYSLKMVIENKFSKLEPAVASDITTKVRERQLNCLARNIYYEAGSEPFEGKVAVAQVTLNRADSGKFPEDICEVIYQKNIFYEKVVCQFSWYCSREATVRPIHKGNYDESMEAAKKVLLEGFRLDSIKDALFYHADYISPGWNKKRIAQIGHHIFYN